MRALLTLLVLLLTASAAPAISGSGTFTEQALMAGCMCCGMPIILLVAVHVWLAYWRERRTKNADPKWSQSKLPPFPPPKD